MPYGMYLSAAGADVQRQRIEVMSNNLANVSTPGFARQLSVIQARHAEAIEQGIVSPGDGTIHDVGGGVGLVETVTDHTRGTLQKTDIPTDFALRGAGYFVVEKEGEQRLTRAGNFTLNSQGELITPGGYKLLSEGGSPITITSPNWRVSPGGTIDQDGISTPVKMVKALPGDLSREGENLYAPLGETTPLRADERQMMSGYLELSNVSPTSQMMELIEASRAYEANIRMIQNQDQMLGSLVSRVLKQ